MPPKTGVALQGGGSHGAFIWAALDRLLQQSAIGIDSVGAFRARHPFRHEHWLFQHDGAIPESTGSSATLLYLAPID